MAKTPNFAAQRQPVSRKTVAEGAIDRLSLEFDGDPIVWAECVFTTILPEGSAPGLWGVADITLQDKALNRKDYTFTEIIEFTI